MLWIVHLSYLIVKFIQAVHIDDVSFAVDFLQIIQFKDRLSRPEPEPSVWTHACLEVGPYVQRESVLIFEVINETLVLNDGFKLLIQQAV